MGLLEVINHRAKGGEIARVARKDSHPEGETSGGSENPVLDLALAKQSSLWPALGKDSKESSVALAMIIAQAINRSSKLAMTKYLPTTTLPDDLGIDVTGVDNYYETLDRLGANQDSIESYLIKAHLGLGCDRLLINKVGKGPRAYFATDVLGHLGRAKGRLDPSPNRSLTLYPLGLYCGY